MFTESIEFKSVRSETIRFLDGRMRCAEGIEHWQGKEILIGYFKTTTAAAAFMAEKCVRNETRKEETFVQTLA
jgi:hypothetical protein